MLNVNSLNNSNLSSPTSYQNNYNNVKSPEHIRKFNFNQAFSNNMKFNYYIPNYIQLHNNPSNNLSKHHSDGIDMEKPNKEYEEKNFKYLNQCNNTGGEIYLGNGGMYPMYNNNINDNNKIKFNSPPSNLLINPLNNLSNHITFNLNSPNNSSKGAFNLENMINLANNNNDKTLNKFNLMKSINSPIRNKDFNNKRLLSNGHLEKFITHFDGLTNFFIFMKSVTPFYIKADLEKKSLVL